MLVWQLAEIKYAFSYFILFQLMFILFQVMEMVSMVLFLVNYNKPDDDLGVCVVLSLSLSLSLFLSPRTHITESESDREQIYRIDLAAKFQVCYHLIDICHQEICLSPYNSHWFLYSIWFVLCYSKGLMFKPGKCLYLLNERFSKSPFQHIH